MKNRSIYSIALIIGAVGGVVTMLFHPTGHDLLAQSGEMARRSQMIGVAAHSLALFSTPILFFGFLGLSRQLDLNRPLVVAALVSYSFGVVAVMCAAVFSGLVATPLAGQMSEADEATRQVLNGFFSYTGLLNQGFAKVFVVASSIAVILWSISLWRLRGWMQALAVMGCVIGAVSLAAFFAGHLRLNVHGFGLFLFGQSVWTILLGVFLLRSGHSFLSRS